MSSFKWILFLVVIRRDNFNKSIQHDSVGETEINFNFIYYIQEIRYESADAPDYFEFNNCRWNFVISLIPAAGIIVGWFISLDFQK